VDNEIRAVEALTFIW